MKITSMKLTLLAVTLMLVTATVLAQEPTLPYAVGNATLPVYGPLRVRGLISLDKRLRPDVNMLPE